MPPAKSPHSILNTLSKNFLDLIFPIRCLGCQKLKDRYLCSTCFYKFDFNKDYHCLDCQQKTNYQHLCPICQPKSTWHLQACLSPYSYRHPLVQNMVEQFKYRFIKNLGEVMAQKMTDYLSFLANHGLVNLQASALTSIPLHSDRLRWRGFNQSHLLAQTIADQTGLPCREILTRVKNTPPQAQIATAHDRKENLKSAFMIKSDSTPIPQSIILIDDVATTGATLNEAARVLKGQGVKKVIALTFAVGK